MSNGYKDWIRDLIQTIQTVKRKQENNIPLEEYEQIDYQRVIDLYGSLDLFLEDHKGEL